MNKIEFLKSVRSVMETAHRNKIDAGDVRYIDMVDDFLRLKAEGHKFIYIVAHLQDVYGVKRSTLLKYVKKLQGETQ